MAGSSDAEILIKIQENHLPFIKKLLSYFEKKKEKSQKHDELRSLYNTFTTASVNEQVSVYNANRKKLDKWYKMYEQVSKTKKREAEDESQENSARLAKQQKVEQRPVMTNAPGSGIAIVSYGSVSSTSNNVSAPKPVSSMVSSSSNTGNSEQEVTSESVTFVCASCQFNTLNETEFSQHAKNDHKNELSLWCRQCWRCFSNIGALVAHIKERSCQKEEMIYKCGVKDCTFEVSSGQTFVHHLRHCHKGSPFIFCVHCQKIFTLPHCLVLHMQNECPYKDRNRKTPGSAPSNDTPNPVPSLPVQPSIMARTLAPARGSTAVAPAPSTRGVQRQAPSSLTTIVKDHSRGGYSSRGRGRGKGRGRGVVRYSDSSDSEDADDPSWMPDPNASTLPVRRSARWAKKVSDARNPDLFDAKAENPRKKSISSAEIREKNLLSCPCCDFMAAIKSVLEDHFIGIHKAPDKNACLVCNVKFENVKFFLDHFENHPEVEPKPPEPIAEVPKKAPVTKIMQASSNSIVSGSSLPPVASNIPKSMPAVITRVHTLGSAVITTPTGAYLAKNHEVLAGIDGDGLECIVENIVSGNENVDVTRGEPLTTIPYQAAIHKKNQKDAKLKKFEDLKSPRDLLTLKEDPNLQHFFKCVMYNCTFTTDEGDSFAYHIDNDHKGRRLHCGYCLTEYFSGAHLKDHMLKDHGKRRWQCSNCFYRACSKAHVQIHIKNMHPSEDARIRTCAMQPIVEDDQGPGDVTKTWPFICAVGDCKFQTFVPQEFKRHNETVHRSVSVFICYYCKVDFISFKRLMDHYRLHGINTYQCTYCVHGSDTKDEILLHLCNVHADKPFKIHFRTAEENVPGGTIQSIRVSGGDNSSNENSNASVEKPEIAPAAEPVAQNSKAKISSKSNESSNNFELKAIKQEKEDDSIEDKFFDQVEGKCYPKKVQRISSDFFCGIPFCDELFDDLSLYISHLRNLHFALNFPCPHCPTFCKDLVFFKAHLLSHGPNLYACNNTACNFYDWELMKVENHAKEHSEESSSIVLREDISDNFENGASIEEIKKIQLASFDEISKVNDLCFECPFCEFKSFHQGTMKNHIYKEISYKRFICNLCQEKFCSRKDTVNHFTEFHSIEDLKSTINVMRNAEIEYVIRKFLMNEKVLNPDSSYNCENCSKVFKSVKEGQHHLRLCLFNNYCPYDCNYCRRSFNDLRLLKFHFDNRHITNKISFTIIVSHNAEQRINQKIQQLRLKHIKNTLEKEQFSSKNLESFLYKYYKCEDCNYKAEFKFDVENHIKTNHVDKNLKVEKVVENLDKSHVLNIVPKEDKKCTLKESTISLRYQCSHCPKKAFYLQELESHMDSHGIQNELENFYYYWPDIHQDFSPTDTDTYECGFCSVKGNLHSLKSHADMLHSVMPLKVKGLVSRPKETNKNIMCSQCYQRMTYSELKKHTNTAHPSLPAKSFNDLENLSLKRKLLAEPLPPPKKVKFEISALSCSHCGGIFSTQQQISEHSRRHHARLPLKYEDLLTDVTDATNHFFFKCDFCPFVSESNFMEKHMSAKHKMLVSCAYCGNRFDSATKLKEHHDDLHKGMRWTIESSKTCNIVQSPSRNVRLITSDSFFEESSPNQSHYGKKPEEIDYGSMTFAIHIDQPYVTDLIAPLAYLFNTFDMFPMVVVKDCEKDSK